MALILAFLFVFTASALELDVAEGETAVLAEDYGELVFSVDFNNLTSASSGSVVGKTTEKFGSTNIVLFNAGNGNMNFGIAKPSGVSTNMLSTSVASAGYHGHVRFAGLDLTEPGEYTLVYDVLVNAGVAYLEADIGQAPDFTTKVVAYPKVTEKVVSRTFESTANISFVHIQYARYQGGTPEVPLYIDNVKLYYKAPEKKVNVNIMAGEEELYETVTINAGSAVTLPTASDFAEYTPDGKFLKGFMAGEKTVAPGASYTVTADDAETGTFDIYPVFVSIPDAGYGELVFFEDFEGMSGAVSNGSKLPMMGTYAGENVQLYDSGAGSSYEIATPVENGTKMLQVSGGNYPQINFINLDIDKPGTYTFMYDYYLAESTGISFIQSGIDSVEKFDYVKGSVQTVMHTKTLAEGESISKFNIQTGWTNPAIYIDNIRIYYSASAAPVAVKANSIRTTGTAGIRFVAFANKAVRATAAEYGYMVAVKDDSVSDYEKALVFADGERTEGVAATNSFGVKYLFAANYIQDTKDVVYSENGDFLPENLSMGNDGVYFTAVMTNIAEHAYNKQLVVRPYAVIGGKIFYGNVVAKSIYEAAVEMKNSAGYTENAFVENIINTVENA